VFGSQRGRRAGRTSELAALLTVLNDVWSERPTRRAESLDAEPLRIRVIRNPQAGVVSLASRRVKEVARAS
jgi:hypothetical protein